MAALRAHGYHVHDIQSLAHDHRPLAVPTPTLRRTIAPGIHLRGTSVDLGQGCFTNAYTLSVDLDRNRADVVSDADGFHLRDHVAADAALAAVSGSFSFISDDPSYQPVEPRLDFCCRSGDVVSLPTAAKPALLVRDGRPVIETLNATGTLTLGEHPYRWVGSKTARPGPGRSPGTLVVFGAANCRVNYSENPRTGFLRHVDPDANTTPPDPSAVDYVVAHTLNGALRVVTVHPGGGADLFAGNFVLRGPHPRDTRLDRGAPVEITRIAGHDARHLESGISLGPSVADAAAGHTAAYDDGCLGTSPFHDTRHARTLVGLHGRELVLQVLDGAPKSDTFRGTTPHETAALCTAAGLDPHAMYHLDGGASSKIAYLDHGTTRVVGSMHYLQWPAEPREPFRWRGLDGRVLRSALVLRADREGHE